VQYQTTLLIFKDNKEVYRSLGETSKELIYKALKSSI
jgi:thioredoxin 1